MLSTGENNRVVNFDSVIVLTILFFGMVIFSNSVKNKTELDRKPVSAYVTPGENAAVSSPCLRLQIFQKTWISNKDNFNVLAFNRNPWSENKKTGIIITHFLIIRQSSSKIPPFILLYHQYPSDIGEPPLLS